MDYDFSFYMPVQIFGGKNALFKNREALKLLGKRCLIVTGKTAAKKCGALSDLISVFEEEGIDYRIFDKITANPKTADCYEGGKIARESCADFVVGIGGGSPLDAAKAVCVYAANEQIDCDEIYTKPVCSKPLPLAVIGTTAGTGSEISGVSVLTRCDGRKQSVSGKNYYAACAFADPRYTYSLPYGSTVSTALDAYCHAAEAAFSPRADFLTTRFSMLSAGILFPVIKKMSETKALPDEAERDALYYASLYAGFALNRAGTGFPHGMGYALTEDYSVPHGFACAVFLPAYLKEAQKADKELFKKFMNSSKADFDEVRAVIKSCFNFDIKISARKAAEYEERWRTLKNFKNSPADFNSLDAESLVISLFGA